MVDIIMLGKNWAKSLLHRLKGMLKGVPTPKLRYLYPTFKHIKLDQFAFDLKLFAEIPKELIIN